MVFQADKSTGSPEDLQRHTLKYINSRHSPDEAGYSHDSVLGPLSSAHGTEDKQAESDAYVVKKTVHKEETTEVLQDAASREAAVGVHQCFFWIGQLLTGSLQ